MDAAELRRRLDAGQIVVRLELLGLNRARIRLLVRGEELNTVAELAEAAEKTEATGILRHPPPKAPALYEEHVVDAPTAEVALDSMRGPRPAPPRPPEGT